MHNNNHDEEDDLPDRPMIRGEHTPVLNVGHVITLGLAVIVNGVVLAFSVGGLYQRVDGVLDDVTYLKSRDITPGAAQRIAVIEAKLAAQQQADWEWKRELRERLDKIDNRLEQHMEGKK
jgi:hypothetical protein